MNCADWLIRRLGWLALVVGIVAALVWGLERPWLVRGQPAPVRHYPQGTI